MKDIEFTKSELERMKQSKESIVLKKLKDIVDDILKNPKPKI